MAEVVMRVEQPEEIRFTISVTLPLKYWIELMGQLPEKWPSTDLRYQIQDCVRQARGVFWPEAPKEE